MILRLFFLCLIFSTRIVLLSNATENNCTFLSARPIWPEGRETEKNMTVGFRAIFDRPICSNITLKITGSSIYRIYINGNFIGHGPARGPHGWFRVDEWTIDKKFIKDKDNILAIEVAGYNVNSYYLLDQASFLQAEIFSGNEVLFSTGGSSGKSFEARILNERVQKVQRYSFQRPFIEYYRLKNGYDNWKIKNTGGFSKTLCKEVEEKKLLSRGVAYPEFFLKQPVSYVSKGQIELYNGPEKIWKDRSLTDIGPKLKGYTEKELDIALSDNIQKIRITSKESINAPYRHGEEVLLKEGEFSILGFGTDITGFIGLKLKCNSKTKLYLIFDEILTDGDVDFKRLQCINAIGYEFEPGEYNIESFEPYTLQYLKLVVAEGSCDVGRIYVRELANPETDKAFFTCSDPRLNKIFDSAKETFRQNATDIFMDCPSRERAGWLCDSFFTSRVAFDITGNTSIERNFFENYLLPESFKNLPQGMLPMCYPADHYDGNFIPNWALWFVIELKEYIVRSGDIKLAKALEPKVKKLLNYFKKFENEDGLLEKLDGWVFVEWSKANEFVQDVNYPSNMLYAEAIDAASRIYGDKNLTEKANKLRKEIIKQSWDGTFFVDNAIRENGKLKLTGNHTEVCQYYAFFFGIASPETFPALWDVLVKKFGPDRKEKNTYPEIYQANSFVGNYLRMELLSREGLCRQMKDELVDYFLYMADRTGTLWENTGEYASCDHGFASHIAHVLYRDTLGIYSIDTVGKHITLRFSDTDIEWCKGSLPTPDGIVSFEWHKENGKICWKANVPEGYLIDVKADDNVKIKRK
jgi:alpha-L-rhamnosidase